jgi:hypothetical protein
MMGLKRAFCIALGMLLLEGVSQAGYQSSGKNATQAAIPANSSLLGISKAIILTSTNCTVNLTNVTLGITVPPSAVEILNTAVVVMYADAKNNNLGILALPLTQIKNTTGYNLVEPYFVSMIGTLTLSLNDVNPPASSIWITGQVALKNLSSSPQVPQIILSSLSTCK